MRSLTFFDPAEANGVLANFYPASFVGSARKYRTAEHAYQSLKFLYRQSLAEMVRRTKDPGRAKGISRDQERFAFRRWNNVKLDVMKLVVWARAKGDRRFRRALLKTGLSNVVELTCSDPFWGWSNSIGGANHMGRILVEVRRCLRAGTPLRLSLTFSELPEDRLFLRRVRRWL
jgi:N-glycosidase YbiA